MGRGIETGIEGWLPYPSRTIGVPEEVETGKRVSSTLHRARIDVKSLFGGSAVGTGTSQAERINAAHDEVKALRDAART